MCIRDRNQNSIFDQIDLDCKGVITIKSLLRYLESGMMQTTCKNDQSHVEKDQKNVQKLSTHLLDMEEKIQKPQEKQLTYKEFLLASLEPEQYCKKQLLKEVFQYFDISKQNKVTKNDIIQIMSRRGIVPQKEQIEQMDKEILEFCGNKEYFDQKTFCQYMTRYSNIATTTVLD
eukprot:TRINITY_DN10673_c0_g1_i3.p2 TRINITY_DN10673_c0_g1~~TRINITY_DN10673_c0_g1_i3.p2  ORF type:complete len:174 (+),score=27.65 TRINITY_DN10673_c0_g1_i3:183-704(+)